MLKFQKPKLPLLILGTVLVVLFFVAAQVEQAEAMVQQPTSVGHLELADGQIYQMAYLFSNFPPAITLPHEGQTFAEFHRFDGVIVDKSVMAGNFVVTKLTASSQVKRAYWMVRNAFPDTIGAEVVVDKTILDGADGQITNSTTWAEVLQKIPDNADVVFSVDTKVNGQIWHATAEFVDTSAQAAPTVLQPGEKITGAKVADDDDVNEQRIGKIEYTYDVVNGPAFT